MYTYWSLHMFLLNFITLSSYCCHMYNVHVLIQYTGLLRGGEVLLMCRIARDQLKSRFHGHDIFREIDHLQ